MEMDFRDNSPVEQSRVDYTEITRQSQLITNAVVYICKCFIVFWPNDDPLRSRYVTVNITKNKDVLTVFTYQLNTSCFRNLLCITTYFGRPDHLRVIHNVHNILGKKLTT